MRISVNQSVRNGLAVAGLAALLALIGALGYEALTAARAQRQTVEEVLRDYAEIAAERYASNIFLALDYNWLFPVSRVIEQESSLQTPPVDSEIETQTGVYATASLVHRFFAFDSSSGEWVGAEGWPGPPENERLRERILSEAEVAEREGWPVAMTVLPAGLSEGPIVYRGDRDPETRGLSVTGFEGRREGFSLVLERAIEPADGLPTSLADGNAGELVSVRLVAVDGRVLYEAGPPFEPDFSAVAELGPRIQGIAVHVAIPARSAERLVIGGLPASRMPAVGMMLAAAVALLIGGFAVIRRERDLVRMRERFVAGASHELRTPLAQIRMFAETLRLDRVRSPDERARSLEILDREARRLSFLVENLLHFSRPDDPVEEAPAERLELEPLVSNLLESFAPLAKERGAFVRLVSPEPVVAVAERDRVGQVILNLLDNATKYGPSGQSVTVSLRTDRDGWAVIEVDDEGPGVPDAQRDLVWVRFWRGPETGRTTGTGIGLSLVRELVEGCGGRVEIADAPGGGARFRVRLPGRR